MGVTNITQYVKDLEESVKRIDELEAMKDDYYRVIRMNGDNLVKIEKMEKTISQLVDKIAEIANFYYKEKMTPYKCPVCDGRYIVMFKECESACLACHRGIVWK